MCKINKKKKHLIILLLPLNIKPEILRDKFKKERKKEMNLKVKKNLESCFNTTIRMCGLNIKLPIKPI